MRGQATVEWIVIMGVAIMVLAIMLTMNEDGYRFFDTSMRVSQAKVAVANLADAADFVYSQGEGAKTRIRITVPKATNISITTLAAGRGEIMATVWVQGKAETFEKYTDATLTGSVPQGQGGYNIDVEYDGIDVVFSRSIS